MPLYVDLKQMVLREYYRRSYWFQRLPMNQKLVFLLVAVMLVFVPIIIYRSYQLPDSTPSNESNQNFPKLEEKKSDSKTFFSNSVISDTPVRVDFFVMSKCPDARKCELLFTSSLLELSSIINFTISYIAYEKSGNEIGCMHGPSECLGNKQQLCVQNMCSQTTLLKFLQCQSKSLENIPDNGEPCAREASDNQLKWSDVEACVQSEKANELLRKSIQKTQSSSVTKSCTIHLNGKFWCMHDGTWYGCSEGHRKNHLTKAICSRYNGPNKPAECHTSA